MRIKANWLAGLIFLIIAGGIGLSAIPGWWRTESSKIPNTFADGEFADSYNPADIRGSYTFGEVSQLFNIPIADLQAAFILSEIEPSSVQLKELEAKYSEAAVNGMEVGTSSVQLFVAYYKNLPFVVNEEYLPEPAVALLIQKSELTSEQRSYLDSHTVPITMLIGTNVGTQSGTDEITSDNNPESPEEHLENAEFTIKGTTTFRELLDLGVPEEKISELIGQPMPNPLLTIKDFCLDNGLEFGTLKTALQMEIP